MNTKITAQIQTIRDKLAVARVDLKTKKTELEEMGSKCRKEYKRANKVERVSDDVFDRRWRALEAEQEKARTDAYKDHDALEAAEEKLQHDVNALIDTMNMLTDKLHDLQDQKKAELSKKKEAAQYCNHCNKIKPQAPIVCRCK